MTDSLVCFTKRYDTSFCNRNIKLFNQLKYSLHSIVSCKLLLWCVTMCLVTPEAHRTLEITSDHRRSYMEARGGSCFFYILELRLTNDPNDQDFANGL